MVASLLMVFVCVRSRQRKQTKDRRPKAEDRPSFWISLHRDLLAPLQRITVTARFARLPRSTSGCTNLRRSLPSRP